MARYSNSLTALPDRQKHSAGKCQRSGDRAPSVAGEKPAYQDGVEAGVESTMGWSSAERRHRELETGMERRAHK